MLYGVFAETPDASGLPPDVKEFLNRVRNRPQNFGKLLLTVTFHPNPIQIQHKLPFGKGLLNLLEVMLLSNIQPVDILDPLRQIRDDFQKRDAPFKRQIEAELQLRNEMIKATGGLGPRKLKPVLLEASLTEDITFYLCRLGLSFAKKMLPAPLAQRIINSAASEAHLANLGSFLRRYAAVLRSKDTAFAALVERERKRRQQARQEQEKKTREEEERKRRQRRRRRKK